RHLIPHPLLIDAVDTEHDVPLAGEEVAADVAGSGVSGREEELRPRGAAPAAEAGGLGEIVAARVEDADIDDVSGAVAERRGDRIGIAIRNVYTGGDRRDAEGEGKVGLLPDLLLRYVALEVVRC